jgi:hypothetical protein
MKRDHPVDEAAQYWSRWGVESAAERYWHPAEIAADSATCYRRPRNSCELQTLTLSLTLSKFERYSLKDKATEKNTLPGATTVLGVEPTWRVVADRSTR